MFLIYQFAFPIVAKSAVNIWFFYKLIEIETNIF